VDHIETEVQLETELSQPNQADVEAVGSMPGDFMVLGAGGKMGPSLALLIQRACERAGTRQRVIAVSRFSIHAVRAELERSGVRTVESDLLDMESVARLPWCANVLYLAGRKFGSVDRPDFTWAVNTMVPAFVATRFAEARIVVFSTGNVYPPVPLSSGGSVETDTPGPVGEYAQSCLGRERVFEYYSRTNGTRVLLFRLNYAVDLRYGVLVDIARSVHEGKPVSLTVGQFNTIWQGDANSYALRSLALCQSPPTALNVTGPEVLRVRETALFFAGRFGREVEFSGSEGATALLSNAARCHSLLGAPRVTARQLMEWVAHWIEVGGTDLRKPTRFEVSDGKY
jgi:nucleoside-diphosphate-sugar epimerase